MHSNPIEKKLMDRNMMRNTTLYFLFLNDRLIMHLIVSIINDWRFWRNWACWKLIAKWFHGNTFLRSRKSCNKKYTENKCAPVLQPKHWYFSAHSLFLFSVQWKWFKRLQICYEEYGDCLSFLFLLKPPLKLLLPNLSKPVLNEDSAIHEWWLLY